VETFLELITAENADECLTEEDFGSSSTVV
jgi:hypothetical protein